MNTPTITPNLLTLTTATAPYALIVSGNALAPTVKDGDTIAIAPAVLAKPASVPAGTVVLAALQSKTIENAFDKVALLRMNADGDLYTNTATIEAGKFLLLGIHAPHLDEPTR